MKLSYRDWLNQMRYVMKTKHDNDLTDRIGAVYVKNYTEFLGLIEKETEQWCDWSDQCGLCQKWIWTVMTD